MNEPLKCEGFGWWTGNDLLRRVAVGAALLCMGLIAGALIPPAHTAWGETRQPPMPQSFQAGDQISVPILQDIATTLHQIDGRLAHMEAIFSDLSKPTKGATRGN